MRTTRTLATGFATLALLAAATLGVAAQSSPPPPAQTVPAEFSGRIVFGPQVRNETTTTVDGRTETRGGAWTPTITSMSDPRLDGTATISFDTDAYVGPDGTSMGVGTGTWRIENADGAWQGSYNIVMTDAYGSTATMPLVGEGAYDGLTAIWESTIGDSGWDVRGVILPAAPPAPPTAP